jgi:putative nucleotidyltransferase with HDIG domain
MSSLKMKLPSISQSVRVVYQLLVLLSPLRLVHPYSYDHSLHVAFLAPAVDQALCLSERELWLCGTAALGHDIGKTLCRPELLDKVDPLTDEEKKELRLHVTHGVQLLTSVPELAHLAPIVREHHERAGDGKGYPDCLSGADISIYGKIVAVCDSYDALARPRPYSTAKSPQQIRLIIESGAGTQFDHDVAMALLSLLDGADVLPLSNGHGRLSEIAPGLQVGAL